MPVLEGTVLEDGQSSTERKVKIAPHSGFSPHPTTQGRSLSVHSPYTVRLAGRDLLLCDSGPSSQHGSELSEKGKLPDSSNYFSHSGNQWFSKESQGERHCCQKPAGLFLLGPAPSYSVWDWGGESRWYSCHSLSEATALHV